jgi:hypothetical protein
VKTTVDKRVCNYSVCQIKFVRYEIVTQMFLIIQVSWDVAFFRLANKHIEIEEALHLRPQVQAL